MYHYNTIFLVCKPFYYLWILFERVNTCLCYQKYLFPPWLNVFVVYLLLSFSSPWVLCVLWLIFMEKGRCLIVDGGLLIIIVLLPRHLRWERKMWAALSQAAFLLWYFLNIRPGARNHRAQSSCHGWQGSVGSFMYFTEQTLAAECCAEVSQNIALLFVQATEAIWLFQSCISYCLHDHNTFLWGKLPADW